MLKYDKNFGLGDGKCNFFDDCGPWMPEKGFTTKSYYLVQTSGAIMLLRKRGGRYCKMHKKDGKNSFVPIEPQPEGSSILELIRNYTIFTKRFFI